MKRPSRSKRRAAARLAAVQALYQRQMEDTPLTKLLDEFHQHRLGQEIEDALYVRADIEFFDDVVGGVAARQEEIDALIGERLAEGWRIDRLDKTLLQILRAGTYELIARPDVPAKTTISQYIDVAHAFFEPADAKIVNGLLDAVAKAVR